MEPELKKPSLTQEPVKLDIFQHMRIGIKNKEENCFCENDLDKLYIAFLAKFHVVINVQFRSMLLIY